MLTLIVGLLAVVQQIVGDSITPFPISGGVCKKINSCSCHDATRLIDLSPLASDNLQARFSIPGGTKIPFTFLWNPCNDFSYPEGSTTSSCSSVAMCMSNGTYHDNLGTQETTKFEVDIDGNLYIRYTYRPTAGTSAPVGQDSRILIKCVRNSEPGVASYLGRTYYPDETKKDEFLFLYEGDYGCVRPYSAGHSLSAGSVLLIIFFVTVTVYLIFGVLYEMFAHSSTGWNVIPHRGFWVSIATFISAGFRFVFCCNIEKTPQKPETSYDKI